MNQGLTSPSHVLTMLRTVGYKSAAYAISELIDNSIDAEAKNIAIGIATKEVKVKKAVENIAAIGVFDDGYGMDFETLKNCVSIGWGTNLENASGKLGKFGFGLKGAALAFCRRMEVYSWQDGKHPLFTYLDFDERMKSESNELFDPVEKSPHDDWSVFLPEGEMPKSGTLIVWTELDYIQPVRPKALLTHLNQDLCRIFRHFMDDDDDYGIRRHITATHFNPMNEVVRTEVLKANDPIYLLTPNNTPGHEQEATNEIIDDQIIKVNCPNDTEQTVRVISTVAYPDIQKGADGRTSMGKTPLGKHYERNQGISFVRAGREITLSEKGFYTANDPRNRWFGIEVRIPPELDSYLGITNDKQDVTFFKNFSPDQLESLKEEADMLDPDRANKAKLNLELHRLIEIAHRNAYKTVTNRSNSIRITNKPVSPIPKPPINDDSTKADDVAAEKDEATKLEEIKNRIRQQDKDLTEDEVTTEAMKHLADKLLLFENEWAGMMFLDVDRLGNGLSVNINRNHKFYSKFYDHIRSLNDERALMSLQAILIGYGKAEDKMHGIIDADQLEALRDEWGRSVNAYINEWVD